MGKKTAKLSVGGRFQFGVRNHRDDTAGPLGIRQEWTAWKVKHSSAIPS